MKSKERQIVIANEIAEKVRELLLQTIESNGLFFFHWYEETDLGRLLSNKKQDRERIDIHISNRKPAKGKRKIQQAWAERRS